MVVLGLSAVMVVLGVVKAVTGRRDRGIANTA